MGYLKGTSIVFYYLAAASKGDVFKAPATWRAARTQSHFIHITGSYCVWWIAVCLNRCVTCASGEKVNSRVPCGNLNIRRCTWKHALFSATVSQNVLWSTRKPREDSTLPCAPYPPDLILSAGCLAPFDGLGSWDTDTCSSVLSRTNAGKVKSILMNAPYQRIGHSYVRNRPHLAGFWSRISMQ
jgi:hypothetical protein